MTHEPQYQTADIMLYGLLKEFVKELRLRRPTEAETLLWQILRNNGLGVKFRRQHIIGPFIADFCCIEAHLIIEVDGSYHSLPQQQYNDKERTEWLEKQGFKVIRFTNEEIEINLENSIDKIRNEIDKRRADQGNNTSPK